MIEYAEGESDASPMPTPTRIAAICQNCRATPQPTVIRLQTPRPKAMTRVRFARSARRPKGNPKSV
jgi:hypothetical protein